MVEAAVRAGQVAAAELRTREVAGQEARSKLSSPPVRRRRQRRAAKEGPSPPVRWSIASGGQWRSFPTCRRVGRALSQTGALHGLRVAPLVALRAPVPPSRIRMRTSTPSSTTGRFGFFTRLGVVACPTRPTGSTSATAVVPILKRVGADASYERSLAEGRAQCRLLLRARCACAARWLGRCAGARAGVHRRDVGGRATLRWADVDRLRGHISPSPSGERALSWALDVHLAAWERGERSTEPQRLLAAYGAWLEASGVGDRPPNAEALRAAVRDLRARAKLRAGPCSSVPPAAVRPQPAEAM